MPFVIGARYTRDEIHNAVGGGNTVSYLPHFVFISYLYKQVILTIDFQIQIRSEHHDGTEIS